MITVVSKGTSTSPWREIGGPSHIYFLHQQMIILTCLILAKMDLCTGLTIFFFTQLVHCILLPTTEDPNEVPSWRIIIYGWSKYLVNRLQIKLKLCVKVMPQRPLLGKCGCRKCSNWKQKLPGRLSFPCCNSNRKPWMHVLGESRSR